MKTRTDLLNFLAEKYKLERYLEIGVHVPALNFDKIKCKEKIGVDPAPLIWSDTGKIFNVTSDYFLDEVAYALGYNDRQFDLIFIDGLHTAEQVKKDFEGCLKYLSPNGFVVLHDCNPLKEEHTIVPRPTKTGHWNGSCYKFVVQIRDCGHTVDIDNGCFVYRNTEQKRDEIFPMWKGERHLNNYRVHYAWDDFDKNRSEYLNLISWDEFIAAHSLH